MKVLLCAVGLAGAFAAQAYQTNITVNANVDPTIGLTLSDGTTVPSSVNMSYTPGLGMNGYKANLKLWSNAETDMNVYLSTDPQMTDANGDNPIPLTVGLNGTALTTAAPATAPKAFQYSTLFPNGITNGSIALPLAIKQKNPSQTVVAGQYSGVVTLVVTQATTKDGSAISGS
ncbi:CS1 type fimbrial major subunit (plasmid) [Symbiopectobacterium sp. Eva_TO]